MPSTWASARRSNTVDSRAMLAVAARCVLWAANCAKVDASLTLDCSIGDRQPVAAATVDSLPAHPDLDTAKRAEVDPDTVTRRDRRWHDARAGGHDLSGAQRHADAGELVHQPGE